MRCLVNYTPDRSLELHGVYYFGRFSGLLLAEMSERCSDSDKEGSREADEQLNSLAGEMLFKSHCSITSIENVLSKASQKSNDLRR